MAYLNGRHDEELSASGLTRETIRESGIWSAAPEEVQLILGPKDWGPGMVFPYRGLQGEQNHHRW
jgi:hypothetical protein